VSLRRSCGAAGGLALAAQLVASCIFDPSLEGLPCPCQDGWHCDPFSKTCVENTCEPKVVVEDLTAGWAAPHSIYWTWKVNGSAKDFVKYELVLAENEDDLKTRTGTARVFDASNNPELGLFEIPYSSALVESTVTRTLQPNTSYVALLFVTGGNQCEATSAIVAKKTAPPTLSEIVVLGDGPPPAGSRARPVPGSAFDPPEAPIRVRYDGNVDTACLDPPADQLNKGTCGQPVGIDGLDVDLTTTSPALTAPSFNDAYLEVEVEVVDSPAPLYSGWIRFLTNYCGEQDRYSFVSSEIVIPNIPGQRTLLEAPFAELSNYRNDVETPFDFAAIDVARGGTPICGINVGGTKHKDADLIIHRARIAF
jgi:hypothetical protein